MAQLSSALRYSKGSYAYNSSYHKQPDDPFHAPDITGMAHLTNILKLEMQNIHCLIAACHSLLMV